MGRATVAKEVSGVCALRECVVLLVVCQQQVVLDGPTDLAQQETAVEDGYGSAGRWVEGDHSRQRHV